MTGGFPEYLEASLQFSIDTKLLENISFDVPGELPIPSHAYSVS